MTEGNQQVEIGKLLFDGLDRLVVSNSGRGEGIIAE